jgi:competence protein ComEC
VAGTALGFFAALGLEPALGLSPWLLGLTLALLLFWRRLGVVWVPVAAGVFAGLLAGGEIGGAPASDYPLGRLRGRVEAVRSGQWRPGEEWARLEVATVSAGGRRAPLPARLLLSFSRASRPWRVGDGVEFVAAPKRLRGPCNQGVDRIAEVYARRGIYHEARVKDDRAVRRIAASPGGLASFRRRVHDAVLDAASSSSAPVLLALVLGDRRALDPGARELWARAGGAHLLAVSGLHMAIVAGCVRVVLGALAALSRGLAASGAAARLGEVGAIFAIFFFAILTGAPVAALRAAVMAVLIACGMLLAVRAEGLRLLVLCGAGLVAMQPELLRSAAFQLSFAAVAALLLSIAAGSRIKGVSSGGSAVRWLRVSLRTSTVATLATAPFLLHHFGMASFVGVVSNLLLSPLVGGLALLIGLAGAVAVVPAPTVAAALFGLSGRLIDLAISVVHLFSRADFAIVKVAGLSLGDALALVSFFFAWLLREQRTPRNCLLLLAVISLLVGRPVLPTAALSVHFLDAGQGDAILAYPAGGHAALLMDAPGSHGGTSAVRRLLVPALRFAGLRELTFAAASHPEWDHYGGLIGLAAAFPLKVFRGNGAGLGKPSYARMVAGFAAAGVEVGTWRAGDRAALGAARLSVLHPAGSTEGLSANDASLVTELRLGSVSFLLTGDIEALGEASLLRHRRDLGAAVLKVPHHGSATSSGHALLRATRPAVAVAQLGRSNRFGFPASEVRARYRAGGSVWRGTDVSGEIVAETDGQLIRWSSCRTCP